MNEIVSFVQIPKTTLFRDKARLVDEGKLPESFWKKRKTGDEHVKRMRLEEAVAACKGGRMSQAAASMAYRIPKTTIWRRLQQEGKSNERSAGSKESGLDDEIEDHKDVQQNPEFSFCEVCATDDCFGSLSFIRESILHTIVPPPMGRPRTDFCV